MGDGSDAPKREQWWWSAEQLRDSGYRYRRGAGCTMPSLWVNEDAAQCFIAHHDADHGAGTWRPEPPPERKMSDDAVRDMAAKVRGAGAAAFKANPVTEYAADLIEAVLRRSSAKRELEGVLSDAEARRQHHDEHGCNLCARLEPIDQEIQRADGELERLLRRRPR